MSLPPSNRRLTKKIAVDKRSSLLPKSLNCTKSLMSLFCDATPWRNLRNQDLDRNSIFATSCSRFGLVGLKIEERGGSRCIDTCVLDVRFHRAFAVYKLAS